MGDVDRQQHHGAGAHQRHPHGGGEVQQSGDHEEHEHSRRQDQAQDAEDALAAGHSHDQDEVNDRQSQHGDLALIVDEHIGRARRHCGGGVHHTHLVTDIGGAHGFGGHVHRQNKTLALARGDTGAHRVGEQPAVGHIAQ